MNNLHRYFIHYMLNNGVSTKDSALHYCKDICPGKMENLNHLKVLITEINRAISKQFLKITFGTCEVTKKEMVVLLNTKNDNIAKLQLTFSPVHLEFFQAILQEILNSVDYRITFIVCINITSTLTGTLSRDNGQKVLDKWINGGYFVKDDEYIYLGLRTILEFTSYLRSHCPDSLCKLCNELVFKGDACSSCTNIFHSYCINKYFENQDSCPNCNSQWQVADNNQRGENSDMIMEIDADNITHMQRVHQYNRQKNQDSDSESYTEEPGPSSRKHRKRI